MISAPAIQTPTMYVSVLLESTELGSNPQASKWLSKQWRALGVIPNQTDEPALLQQSLIANHNKIKIYKWSGFSLRLVADQLDSYYQNLAGKNASVFIICHRDENNNPKPFLTTLSYDEAAVYMEADEWVLTSAIDPIIYKQVEQFVLAYYHPPEFKKRKRVKGSAGDQYNQSTKGENNG